MMESFLIMRRHILMQEHPRVVGYPACLGDLMEFCGLIFMCEGFGRVVWTYLGLG